MASRASQMSLRKRISRARASERAKARCRAPRGGAAAPSARSGSRRPSEARRRRPKPEAARERRVSHAAHAAAKTACGEGDQPARRRAAGEARRLGQQRGSEPLAGQAPAKPETRRARAAARRRAQARRRGRLGRRRAAEARPRDARDPGAGSGSPPPRSSAPSCSGPGCGRCGLRCAWLWRAARAAVRLRRAPPDPGARGRRGGDRRLRGARRLAVARLPRGQRRHRRVRGRGRRDRPAARGRERDRRQRPRLGDGAARGRRRWSRSASRSPAGAGWRSLLVPIGLAVIAIVADRRRPEGPRRGRSPTLAYEGASASLLEGFWIQLATAAVLVACGLLLPRYLRPQSARELAAARLTGPTLFERAAAHAARRLGERRPSIPRPKVVAAEARPAEAQGPGGGT